MHRSLETELDPISILQPTRTTHQKPLLAPSRRCQAQGPFLSNLSFVLPLRLGTDKPYLRTEQVNVALSSSEPGGRFRDSLQMTPGCDGAEANIVVADFSQLLVARCVSTPSRCLLTGRFGICCWYRPFTVRQYEVLCSTRP